MIEVPAIDEGFGEANALALQLQSKFLPKLPKLVAKVVFEVGFEVRRELILGEFVFKSANDVMSESCTRVSDATALRQVRLTAFAVASTSVRGIGVFREFM